MKAEEHGWGEPGGLLAKIEQADRSRRDAAESRQSRHGGYGYSVIDGGVAQNTAILRFETLQQLVERDPVGCGESQEPRR
jgi:hypothetical protein